MPRIREERYAGSYVSANVYAKLRTRTRSEYGVAGLMEHDKPWDAG